MDKAVIARIVGGLGNQLFCYAAARRLSIVNDMPLRLDVISGFKYDFVFKRRCVLHQFNIKSEKASSFESFYYPGGRLARFICRKIDGLLPREDRYFLNEKSKYGFDPEMLSLRPKRSVYMEGYWQSEMYFKDVEDRIRDDLRITAPIDKPALDQARAIEKAEDPVCLGIRFFKEARCPEQAVLSNDYYTKAVDEIAKHLRNPHFFIFSDSPESAKERLSIGHPCTFISREPDDMAAYKDIWLMGLCRHFIISNSTFHWWGAWLANSKDKMVICPESGFCNKDFIPRNWRILR